MKYKRLMQIIEEEISAVLKEDISDEIAAADRGKAHKTPRAIHSQKTKLVDHIREIITSNSESGTFKVVGESPSPEILEIYISQTDEGAALTSKFGAGEGLNDNSLNYILKRLVTPGMTPEGKKTLSELERFTREGRGISDPDKYHRIAGGIALDNFEEIEKSYPLGPGEGITLKFSWDEDVFNLRGLAGQAQSSTLFPGSAASQQIRTSWAPPKPWVRHGKRVRVAGERRPGDRIVGAGPETDER